MQTTSTGSLLTDSAEENMTLLCKQYCLLPLNSDRQPYSRFP